MKNTTTLIGITGNIATGKSVVRRMLANAGALELDADVIAHRMIYPQGPAYKDVVNAFGQEILNERGEISRSRLGEMVFTSPDQLAELESIVHPAVTKAIQHRLDHMHSPLTALEAIKLLEAGLGEICDVLWVSHVPQATQLERLLQARGLTKGEAWSRINAQPRQDEKLKQADAVIQTNGPFKHTWEQVNERLNDTIQQKDVKMPPPLDLSRGYTGPSFFELPSNKSQVFWETHAGEDSENLYQASGMGMVQPLIRTDKIQALLLWENWNFTAKLTRILLDESQLLDYAVLIETFTEAARRQGCEITLLPDELARTFKHKPELLGFKRWKPEELPYPAWRIAADEVKSTEENLVWARVLSKPLESERYFQLK